MTLLDLLSLVVMFLAFIFFSGAKNKSQEDLKEELEEEFYPLEEEEERKTPPEPPRYATSIKRTIEKEVVERKPYAPSIETQNRSFSRKEITSTDSEERGFSSKESYIAPIYAGDSHPLKKESYKAPIYAGESFKRSKRDAYSIPLKGGASFGLTRLNQESLREAIILKILLDQPKALDDKLY
jgi:hypothetical protein